MDKPEALNINITRYIVKDHPDVVILKMDALSYARLLDFIRAHANSLNIIEEQKGEDPEERGIAQAKKETLPS